jgi:hypothetical protein
MTESAPVELPLEIHRVHGSRPSAGELRLALSGAWHGSPEDAGQEPLLVIQIEGRRHRFPAEHDAHAAELPGGRWRATFSLPDWAEPRHEGQAAVWIGNAVVPVPPMHTARRPSVTAADRQAEVEDQSDDLRPSPAPESQRPGLDVLFGRASPPEHPRTAPSAAPDREEEPARSGPLADLLLKETVAALRAELEQRTAESARLHGALGNIQSELEARADTQSRLEDALGELSTELKELMATAERQRAELAVHEGELAQARAQAEEERAELVAAHAERLAAAEAGLAEAEAGLAEAEARAERAERRAAESRALREQLASAQVAREAARSEVSGLQAELSRIGAELAVTRERVASESGELGQASRLLADARALAEQLRRARHG